MSELIQKCCVWCGTKGVCGCGCFEDVIDSDKLYCGSCCKKRPEEEVKAYPKEIFCESCKGLRYFFVSFVKGMSFGDFCYSHKLLPNRKAIEEFVNECVEDKKLNLKEKVIILNWKELTKEEYYSWNETDSDD